MPPQKLFQKENDMIENYIRLGKTIPPDSFSDQMYLPNEPEKLLNLYVDTTNSYVGNINSSPYLNDLVSINSPWLYRFTFLSSPSHTTSISILSLSIKNKHIGYFSNKNYKPFLYHLK